MRLEPTSRSIGCVLTRQQDRGKLSTGHTGITGQEPKMSWGPVDPVDPVDLWSGRESGEARQMMVRVAPGEVDGGQAFEVVAHQHFIGHAHAAVQLDGLLGDEAS